MKAWRLLLSTVLLLPSAVAAQTPRTVTAPSGAVLVHSRNPNTVILSLVEEPGELRSSDPGPSVRVFGDGRVLIHYPAYMTNAGDFELRLTDAEAQQLLAGVAASGLPDLNVEKLRKTRRAVQAQRRSSGGTVQETSDATVSVFLVELDSYQPAGARKATTRVRHSVRWPALEFDAEHYPELIELKDLNQLRIELNALRDRPDRRRLR